MESCEHYTESLLRLSLEMLSENGKTLIVLRNPVWLYKNDKIEADPRDGMEITFSAEDFKPTKLLTWKK